MKKNFLLIVAMLFSASMFAQTPFVVSPTEFEGRSIMLLGEAMSQNRTYVGGTDQSVQIPMIWNTETGELIEIAETDSVFVDWGEESYWEYMTKTGAFHAVNNAGIAVGSLTGADYISHPIMARADGHGTYTFLHESSDNAGCEAYGITEDGSTIVGFYFDANWITHACVWTQEGTVCTDLPMPAEADLGFPIDYVSARYISSDGNVILGYAQDANTGTWVAMTWKLQGGQYVPVLISNSYYQTRYYEGDSLVIPGENPYYEFQPVAISANGEWASLMVVEAYDVNDFSIFPSAKAARLNLVTGAFEVLDIEEDFERIEMFGIADDGTCVGRFTGVTDPATWSQDVDAVLWKAGTASMQRLSELYPDDAYVTGMVASSFNSITADGAYAMGISITESSEQTTFYVRLPGSDVSINQPAQNVSLYPCPATNVFTVTLNSEIRSLSVVNMMGQVVYAKDGIHSNQVSVDTRSYAAGLYLVNIFTDNGRVTKRLSIVK